MKQTNNFRPTNDTIHSLDKYILKELKVITQGKHNVSAYKSVSDSLITPKNEISTKYQKNEMLS